MEKIFGGILNEDAIAHSRPLLQFLGGMEDKLSAEHIDLIWTSCTKASSVDLKVWGEPEHNTCIGACFRVQFGCACHFHVSVNAPMSFLSNAGHPDRRQQC